MSCTATLAVRALAPTSMSQATAALPHVPCHEVGTIIQACRATALHPNSLRPGVMAFLPTVTTLAQEIKVKRLPGGDATRAGTCLRDVGRPHAWLLGSALGQHSAGEHRSVPGNQVAGWGLHVQTSSSIQHQPWGSHRSGRM